MDQTKVQQIEVAELPNQIATVLAAVAQGEEIILTQDDAPVAKLVQVAPPKPRRRAGSARGQIVMAPDFDEPLDDFACYPCQ